jgi:predicted nuclease of predicted toxin-antitoxin system
MRILLDNNIDHRFLKLLAAHDVTHVQKIGWDRLKNGDLIAAAEREGYAVLVTADKNLRYQQSLKDRILSIIILNSLFVDYQGIAPLVPQVLAALNDLAEGSFITITPLPQIRKLPPDSGFPQSE